MSDPLGISPAPSTPPFLSDETKKDISQAVRSVTNSVNEIVSESWNGWEVEGVDSDGDVPSAVDRALDRLSHATTAQQITAGGVSGWVTGFLFNKFGKPVLYLAGGTLIIALFAEHQGYLKIDWSKVRQDYTSGRRAVSERIHTLHNTPTGILARKNGRTWLRKLKKLAQSSPPLCGGYLGGILLGLAS